MQNLLEKIKPTDLDAWFAKQWQGLTPNLYLSCDIRNAGYKMGAVDANLFPGGFNNLCTAFSRDTTKAFDQFLNQYYPQAKKILIYGEEHTRNKFYLKNLFHLEKLIAATGREVHVGMVGTELPADVTKVEFEDKVLEILRLKRIDLKITAGSFIPDLVISNNDFSDGAPEILQNIEQSIIPSPNLGWHKRQKFTHFQKLHEVLNVFGKDFGVDPWLLAPLTDLATGIDVTEEASLQKLAKQVDAMLEKISAKYQEYHITDAPYVYIKSNSGTYGLGLVTAFSGEDVLSFNRKKRNKLQASKGSQAITEYLIQEGIPTVDTYSEYPVEPVIYAVGKDPVGGFFRIHESKNNLESLNAPGMSFSCLCLHKLDEPHEAYFMDCKSKEQVLLLSKLLARFSCLAAAKE